MDDRIKRLVKKHHLGEAIVYVGNAGTVGVEIEVDNDTGTRRCTVQHERLKSDAHPSGVRDYGDDINLAANIARSLAQEGHGIG